MTLSLTHKFHSAKDDSGDQSLVRPTNWNDEHAFVMAQTHILGRYSTGQGAVQEVEVGTTMTLAGGKINIADNIVTDLGKFAHIATLVSEQDELDITKFGGGSYVVVWNGNEKDGKISVSDFMTAFGIVSDQIDVTGGDGLVNLNNHTRLTSDIVINMKEPNTLDSKTINNAKNTGPSPVVLGHTHELDTHDICTNGCGTFIEISFGSTCFAKLDDSEGGARVAGYVVAGNQLTFSNVFEATGNVNAGSWMLHGHCSGDADGNRSSWSRINNPTASHVDVEYRNPKYNGDNTVNVELHYVDLAKGVDVWHPATLNVNDVEPYYVQLLERLIAEGTIAPYTAPSEASVRANMNNISQRQLRIALLNDGINGSMILAAIAGIASDHDRELAEIEFVHADRFRRMNPSIIGVLSELGYTTAGIDELWNEALVI